MRIDNNEDDSKYPPRAYGVNNQRGNASSLRSKLPLHNDMHSRTNNQYAGDEEDVEDEELEEEEGDVNGVRMIGKDNYVDVDDDDGDDDDDTEDDDDNDEDDDDLRRPRKKRNLKTLISNYEFAPRVPAPPTHQATPSRPSSGGLGIGQDWTECETFALLDVWGDRFLKLGRKSLRSEEWQEVGEKLSQETNIERTDSECRNRFDTLKKKYKKEKMRLAATGGGSKWPFYRKMDMLMYSPPHHQTRGLSCGIDSGEYVFMNPRVYLNRANGLDEMRDSPGNSESSRDEEEEEEDSDGLPPKGKRSKGGRRVDGSSFRLLADSIQKFSEIYEKIEMSKRKQMVELENMRMDFQRQVETQRRQILERAQAEIAKIRQGDEDENELSAENLSG